MTDPVRPDGVFRPGPPNFTDRAKELVELSLALSGDGWSDKRLRNALAHGTKARDDLVVLYAATGVGKTQLAAEYVRRFAHDYSLIWKAMGWHNALDVAEQVEAKPRLILAAQNAEKQRTEVCPSAVADAWIHRNQRPGGDPVHGRAVRSASACQRKRYVVDVVDELLLILPSSLPAYRIVCDAPVSGAVYCQELQLAALIRLTTSMVTALQRALAVRLTRPPPLADAVSYLLVILSVCMRYGRRDEPDHVLPMPIRRSESSAGRRPMVY
ncbi:hypothetical protein ACRYCC_31050 [Actinomadura scrupuli]|uniref:hypothetical protein n=1 Tax=Actinomadura scrupuli TaxID=559629 RepID=UPI003D97DF32